LQKFEEKTPVLHSSKYGTSEHTIK